MILEVNNLRCGYGDITAVDDVSFKLDRGEILGLIGANGAGKTSTLAAIAGLIPVRSGSVLLNGRDLSTVAVHQRTDLGLALVPEGRRIFAELSVSENLLVGGIKLNKQTMQKNRSTVFDAFPRLGERQQQLAGSLSGGEQQMLAIGRGMMSNPTLLLVDELSLGLMPIAIDECYRVLETLQNSGIAIVLVEQNTERVLNVANNIAVLESGRLTWSGTGEKAMGNTSIIDSYLGSAVE